MVFFQTRLGKILIWQKFSAISESDFKSIIDLILTNKPNSFQKSSIIETSVSDYHKLVGTFFKSHFKRFLPKTVYYRNYENLDQKSMLNDIQATNFKL